MAAGQLLEILYCTETGLFSKSIAPCVTRGDMGFAPKTMTAYVIGPETASAIESISAPIDYVGLGALWGFGFSLTLTLWMIAKCAGTVINSVRRF